MTIADLKSLFEYNRWANERIASAAVELSSEQFTLPLPGSFPTMRDTLAHLVSAEWVWVHRCRGVSPNTPPAWLPAADAETLRLRLREVEAELGAFLDALNEEDLARPVRFVYLSGKEGEHRLEELVLHVVNHSTYHRGQLASMFRAVGAAAPPTDLLIFSSEQGARAGAA